MTDQIFPFLDVIEANHGPKIELGRYWLWVAESARQVGITWHMGRSFDRLVEVNAQNQDSWAPLAPIYDPAFSDISEEDCIYLEGQHDGEPVVTMALRRFDWAHTNLRDEWESGRLAYRDPASQMQPGEQWIAAAPMAAKISGRVVDSGGLWCHPDFRSRRIPALTMALMRSVTLAEWNPDYLTGQIETGARARALLSLYGHPAAQPGMRIIGSWRSFDCILVWESRDYITGRVAERGALAGTDQPDPRYGRDENVRAARAPGE